jgi:hypothetical protein
MLEAEQIRGCIFGEEWSKSCDEAWKLLQARPELKSDPDLGRSRNDDCAALGRQRSGINSIGGHEQ